MKWCLGAAFVQISKNPRYFVCYAGYIGFFYNNFLGWYRLLDKQLWIYLQDWFFSEHRIRLFLYSLSIESEAHLTMSVILHIYGGQRQQIGSTKSMAPLYSQVFPKSRHLRTAAPMNGRCYTVAFQVRPTLWSHVTGPSEAKSWPDCHRSHRPVKAWTIYFWGF
jgi:hypothetical protein